MTFHRSPLLCLLLALLLGAWLCVVGGGLILAIGLASLVVGIEEMGGAVRFAPTPGGGATTVVTMPARRPAPQPA